MLIVLCLISRSLFKKVLLLLWDSLQVYVTSLTTFQDILFCLFTFLLVFVL